MAESPPEHLREQYRARVNRSIDYIEQHLTRSLSLTEIAKAAAFSPYHFHRIFGAMVGETLHQFITRLRLERAAGRLLQNPDISVTEIAIDLGFSGSNSFARAFKKQFGMSASAWREGGSERKIGNMNRKEGIAQSKTGESLTVVSGYANGSSKTWRITVKKTAEIHAEVEVKELPVRHVAYVRHVGAYAGDGALFAGLFERLCRWAGPRELLGKPDSVMMAVYHDNPEVTDDSKLRTSVCLTVPEDLAVDGEIGKMTVPGGRYAVGRFEVGEDEFGAAWETLYGTWLPASGYQPDNRPCFEIFQNDPEQHPQHKFVVDICVPVKPM